MVHLFSKNGLNILMDVNSGGVHLLDEAAFAVASKLPGGAMEEQCPAWLLQAIHGIPEEAVLEAYGELYALFCEGLLHSTDEYIDISRAIPEGAPVKALCLHVSHDCNLRCGYCFAGTGDFGTGRRTMSPAVARRAIDFVIERSGARRNIEIDFFGGEPLMAFDTVRETVAYAKSLEGRHGKHFRFTMTTNGLLLSDETIDYINREMSNVVLSLDGRPETNDAMRKTVDGRGSYHHIVPKFQALVRERSPQKDHYIRGTFTARNLDFSNDVLHLAELGFDRLSIEPVSLKPGSEGALSEEMLPRIFEEYDRLCDALTERKRQGKPLHFFHFMVDLEQGPCVIKRLRGCGAGYEYVAVTPEGDIYPCHQFVGQEEFRQGNVLDGTFDQSLADRFSALHIYSREDCVDCWAKFYCSGGCSAANHLIGGTLETPDPLACAMEKKRLECAIYLKALEAISADQT